MSKTALLAATAVLALTAGGASAAIVHPGALATGVKIVAPPTHHVGPGVVLWNQNSLGTGSAFVSDNFTSGLFTSYDAALADDFVPQATPASGGVTEVDVSGAYFNGPGPATTINITFYKNKKASKKTFSHPSTVLKGGTFDNLPIVAVQGTRPGCFDTSGGAGSFQCLLPTGKHGKAEVKVKKGDTYWVSVVANMAYLNAAHTAIQAGEWGWDSRTPVLNDQAVFQNPLGTFGVGCETWTPVATCFSLDEDEDLMFQIIG